MERKSDIETASECENCGKELHGRIDKRFCNDTCRNEFNRRKKQAEALKANEAMPEILRIIRRNYEILQSLGNIPDGSQIFLPKTALLQKGLDFRFYTSVKDNGEERYSYCFERGWRESDGTVYIQDDFKQAEI